MKRILVIDDDLSTRSFLSILLKKHGFDVALAADADQGLEKMALELPDVVLTDYDMPGKSGIDVISEISKRYPGLPVILMTAYDDVPITIKSMQAGAFDYIEKTTSFDKYIDIIKKGLLAAEKHKSTGKSDLSDPEGFSAVTFPVGKTPEMKEIFKQIGQISLNRLNVMITGEKGTEKDKIAHLIHQSGDTNNFPFFHVNCKLFAEKSLDVELFGCEKDAIPESISPKAGKFELAKKGSVFLDDFSNIAHDIQTKLIEALKNRHFVKIGGDSHIMLDARVIVAFDENPKALIDSGRLLNELYLLLKVYNIYIPPLRSRKSDIPAILEEAIKLINFSQNTRIAKIEEGVIEMLQQYDWPGNIKEFESTILQAATLSRSRILEIEHVAYTLKDKISDSDKYKKRSSLADIEKEQIIDALGITGKNLNKACELLGMSLQTLKLKIQKYNIGIIE